MSRLVVLRQGQSSPSMTFSALLNDEIVWSLNYDDASWNELQEKRGQIDVNLALRCCGGVPVLQKNKHGTFWFAHPPNSPCEEVERHGDDHDADTDKSTRTSSRGVLGVLPELIQ